MREMNERMMKVAVGKIEKEAIKLVSIEYLNYMIEHPGVYETIQWAVWHGTEETATIFNNYLSLLTTLIQSCSLNKDKTLEILNMLTGIIHGYTTLQLGNAFSAPDKVRFELAEAIDTLLVGISRSISNIIRLTNQYRIASLIIIYPTIFQLLSLCSTSSYCETCVAFV